VKKVELNKSQTCPLYHIDIFLRRIPLIIKMLDNLVFRCLENIFFCYDREHGSHSPRNDFYFLWRGSSTSYINR